MPTGAPCGDASDWTLAREYVYGNGFLDPVAMIDYTDAGDPEYPAGVPEVLHYVRDALGSVVGLTSQADFNENPPVPGTLVERYDYDPYGRTYIEHWDPTANANAGGWVRTTASFYGNPIAWTAQRYDAGVGLYQFYARTYSPELGRWLQRDPLGYVDGVNLYEYESGRPLKWTDPLGLMASPPGEGAGMAGTLAHYASNARAAVAAAAAAAKELAEAVKNLANAKKACDANKILQAEKAVAEAKLEAQAKLEAAQRAIAEYEAQRGTLEMTVKTRGKATRPAACGRSWSKARHSQRE
jgi:RHS repeat-associated protein